MADGTRCSACAACYHVCPSACSNADFHTPSPISLADWRHTHVECCFAPRAKTLAVGALRRLAAPTITSAPVPAACSNAELLLISFVGRLRQTGVVPT